MVFERRVLVLRVGLATLVLLEYFDPVLLRRRMPCAKSDKLFKTLVPALVDRSGTTILVDRTMDDDWGAITSDGAGGVCLSCIGEEEYG